MLRRLDLIDKARMRHYLLCKTQHIIGGFGKGEGEPPGRLMPKVYTCWTGMLTV